MYNNDDYEEELSSYEDYSCVWCNGTATMKEESNAANIFCNAACQFELYEFEAKFPGVLKKIRRSRTKSSSRSSEYDVNRVVPRTTDREITTSSIRVDRGLNTDLASLYGVMVTPNEGGESVDSEASMASIFKDYTLDAKYTMIGYKETDTVGGNFMRLIARSDIEISAVNLYGSGYVRYKFSTAITEMASKRDIAELVEGKIEALYLEVKKRSTKDTIEPTLLFELRLDNKKVVVSGLFFRYESERLDRSRAIKKLQTA